MAAFRCPTRTTFFATVPNDDGDPSLRGGGGDGTTPKVNIGGFLHLYIGQEAIAVGAARALQERG